MNSERNDEPGSISRPDTAIRGNVLREQGQEAFQRGLAASEAGRLKEAEEAFLRTIALLPGTAGAYNNLGNIYLRMNRLGEAVTAYRKVIGIQPGHGYAQSQLVNTRRMLVSWDGLDSEVRALLDLLRVGRPVSVTPFSLVALREATPELLRLAALHYTEKRHAADLATAPLATVTMVRPGKPLRIGYLSADFQKHATTHLLAGVIEAHDKAGFEIHLFSYSRLAEDAYRRRLRRAGGAFHDLSALDDMAAARYIASRGIDILVDLKGYTRGSRMGINARRPAPVIVNWLGYPGSLGHPRLADYLIGDAMVTPLEHAAHYSETLALMPHCYQPNDRSRAIGPTPSRRDAGLPERGFVFCSFNQSYKIDATMFDLWCRLLRELPESMLWLLAPDTEDARLNLLRETARRGVAEERIVFAPSLEQTEHLGRLRLADLALDTFPVTSHTTGSDALWAGVPLLTRLGETFASRVAGSLLRAVGLPELVCHDDDGYFALALRLARDSSGLAAIRQHLERRRLSSPLFDTEGFTRDLERLYQAIWRQAVSGKRQAITLDPAGIDRACDA
jgi:predicted O-linked N-acetylglucosamine transferase (SPINDLY family)